MLTQICVSCLNLIIEIGENIIITEIGESDCRDLTAGIPKDLFRGNFCF